jgi:hypothetical protein
MVDEADRWLIEYGSTITEWVNTTQSIANAVNKVAYEYS